MSSEVFTARVDGTFRYFTQAQRSRQRCNAIRLWVHTRKGADNQSPMVVQFHDGADEILNHQGHEGSRRFLASEVSFVYLRGLGG